MAVAAYAGFCAADTGGGTSDSDVWQRMF